MSRWFRVRHSRLDAGGLPAGHVLIEGEHRVVLSLRSGLLHHGPTIGSMPDVPSRLLLRPAGEQSRCVCSGHLQRLQADAMREMLHGILRGELDVERMSHLSARTFVRSAKRSTAAVSTRHQRQLRRHVVLVLQSGLLRSA